MARLALALALAAAACAPAARAQPAHGGRYEAQLCVAIRPEAPPSCGAAEVEFAGHRLSVRVADVVYRLVLRSAQVDVSTMQEKMEIDEFSAPYEWRGQTLRFSDNDKNVVYEVRLGARKAARR